MTRPLLLLDVDGVLNPFASAACPPGYIEEDILGYRVRLNVEHGWWLRELAEHLDVVWATTWMADANRRIAPRLKLPEWPHIVFTHGGGGHTWKLADVAAYVGDRAAAWIDDDLWPDAYEWQHQRLGERLLVHIEPERGLQRGDVERLLDFARELAERTAATRLARTGDGRFT